jgi:phage shock protein PspC (stress-responsive transcriptional regulator)
MSPTTEPRATLHAIWQTRPGRRQGDRKIAGVAAAVARRYDIDPVLVRIAFVVAAFYGVGILLYLGAWVALPPDPSDPPRGPFVRRGGAVHPLVLIAAIVAALAGAGSLLSGDPGVLVGLAVLGGLLYVLHQSRSERGLTAGATTSGQVGEAAVAADPAGLVPGAGPPGAGSSGAVAGGSTGAGSSGAGSSGAVAGGSTSTTANPAAMTSSGSRAGVPPGAEQPKPPAWDPLGAAPFAWDLPEPGAAPAQVPARRRSVLTAATIGLALLAGGVTGAIVLADSGFGGVRLIIGVMLAVLGLGLVLGAFRHTGRGLIAVAIPLVLVSYAATAVPVHRWQGAGELHAAPTTLAELAPSYRRTLGEVTLDLRGLNLTPLAAQPPAAPGAPVAGTPSVPGVPVAGTPAVPGAPVAGTPAIPGAPVAGAPLPGAPVPGAPVPGAPAAAPPVPGAPVPGTPVPPGAAAAVRTVVGLEAGEATVLLPPNLAVRVHCHADVGDVDCLGQRGRGQGPAADVTVTDPAGALRPQLELDVTVQAGQVEVHRG